MNKKLNEAYKSIGEVAKMLNLINPKNNKLNTHTLRFWEKEFKQVKPKILLGNRRYYDNKTIDILEKIQFLLKEQGMTIKGVKKALKQNELFKLDVLSNQSININNYKIKSKFNKIKNLVKEIKKLK